MERSIPPRSLKLPEFCSSTELEKGIRQLTEKRMVVISGLDESILLAAAYALADRPELKAYEKRMLIFEKNNLERYDLRLEMFVNQKIGCGKRLVIVIDVKLQSFFDSMFFHILHFESIKKELRNNDTMLICLVSSYPMQETLRKIYLTFDFFHWRIPFLSHLLRQKFSESEARDLELKILEQQKLGLWAENEAEFYQSVSGYLQNGRMQFGELVEKLQLDGCSKNKDVNKFLHSIELSRDKEQVKITVLYVAAFFPELTPHDFRKIVLLLLKDKKTTVDIESQIIAENGDVKALKTQGEKELVEIWREDHDNILKECHLTARYSENSSKAIDFSLPYLRKQVKKYLEQACPMYLQEQFERIQESGLLFAPDASQKIIEQVATISSEMAVSDPDYYGQNWLTYFIIGLKQQYDLCSAPAGHEFEQLLQLMEMPEGDTIRKQFLARISDLLREMLNHPHLQDMVRNFFNQLIETRHHDMALEIVLEVAKRLWFAPHFDALYWIKRLLDQGHEAVRSRAYIFLYNHAKQCGPRIYELLEVIKTWLPEPDRDLEKYAPSNQYALIFIVDYCTDTMLAFDSELYGQWPSQYPLFSALQNPDMAKIRMKILSSWLFHPGIKSVLNENFIINKEIIINTLMADLIEGWFAILHGLQKDNVHPEAREISDILLQQVISVTNRAQRQGIMNRWRLKRCAYIKKVTELDNKQRAQKGQLMGKREIIMKLEERFSKAQSASNPIL